MTIEDAELGLAYLVNIVNQKVGVFIGAVSIDNLTCTLDELMYNRVAHLINEL